MRRLGPIFPGAKEDVLAGGKGASVQLPIQLLRLRIVVNLDPAKVGA